MDVKPALTAREMTLISYATTLTCAKSYQEFTTAKKQKKHPFEMVDIRDKLETCYMKTSIGVKDHCAEELDALDSCFQKNPKAYVKCGDLIRALQKCALKNHLSE